MFSSATGTSYVAPTPIPASQVTAKEYWIELSRRIFTPQGNVNRELEIKIYSQVGTYEVKGDIYDSKGRHISKLEIISTALPYIARWNGRDESGQLVSSGIYIFQIQIEDKNFRDAVVVAR